MSNIKKIIGVVLALVMVLSMASVAFAADGDYYEISFNVVGDKTELAPGESTTIEVRLTANFYVSAISIPVFFDNSQVDVTVTPKLERDEDQPDRISIADNNSDADAIKKFYESVPEGKKSLAFSAFVYVGKYYDTLYKDYNNELVMTLEVTAKADAKSTVVPFDCIKETIKTTTHPSGALYVAKNSSGNAEVDSVGEVIDDARITKATTEITVKGNNEPADLELKAKGESDGVVIDRRITFGGQYSGVVYGFNQAANGTFRTNTNYLTDSLKATNDGTLEFSRSIGTAGWGTGTVITVKNSDGSLSGKTYVVVIFGDVNCDGFINGNDTSALKSYVSQPSSLTNLVIRMASNCQNIANSSMLYNVNGNDYSALKAYVGNSGNKVSQATLAATFYKTTPHNNYK